MRRQQTSVSVSAADELDVVVEAYASRESLILLQHREKGEWGKESGNRDVCGVSGPGGALRESR